MNRYTRAIEKKVQQPAAQNFFIESSNNRYQFTNLYRIRIESASACNLRCVYCPTGVDYNNPNIPRQTMPADIFDRLVHQLTKLPTIQVSTMYLGGEPLINKDLLPNIQRLLNETTIKKITINTNGMLITEDFCRELSTIKNAELFSIQISIDGKQPEENNIYRRGSDYEKIKNNVIMMRKILPANFQVVIANVQVPTADEVNTAAKPSEFLRTDFSELLTQAFGPFGIESLWAQIWPGLEDEYLESQGYQKKSQLEKDPCAFPFYEVSIRANGDVVPCCYDLKSENVMGNISDENLIDILNSPRYRKLRESLVTYYAFGEKHLLPEMCHRCVLVSNEMLYK